LLALTRGESRTGSAEGRPTGQPVGLTRQIESAYYALRHTLLRGRVLRSKDPAGIQQEMWALLVLYQAIRAVMVTAVETQPGTDPDRAAFTIAVEAARDSLTTATGILPPPTAPTDLVGLIGSAVLKDLLPARRLRFSVRTVKCGISRHHTWNADDRPPTSADITAIEVTVHRPDPPHLPPTHQTMSATTAAHPPHGAPLGLDAPACPPGRATAVLAIIRSAPQHPWRARDIARTLGIVGEKALNSFCVQLSTWARQGLLTKTAPATYTITPSTALTPTP
jgi:hypothetical protein